VARPDGVTTQGTFSTETEYETQKINLRMFSSLVRVLGIAPTENKIAIYTFLAGIAATIVAADRQDIIDLLQEVAAEQELDNLAGADVVQDALSTAFRGAA
jgi:hypothetical protein